MIYAGGHKNIVDIYYNDKYLVAKYYGSRLVWERVRSCYGSGIWVETKPWLDDDYWKDNK